MVFLYGGIFFLAQQQFRDLHYFANRNSKPMPSCDISPFANRLWDTMASMASLV